MVRLNQLDYAKIQEFHSGLMIPLPKDTNPHETYSYDKNSQYANLVLRLKDYPTLKSKPRVFKNEPKFYDGFICKVFATRKPNRRGILYNKCADMVMDQELFFFKEEFDTIFKHEFNILEIEITKYIIFQKSSVNDGLKMFLNKKMKQKDTTESKVERNVLKDTINKAVGSYFYSETNEVDKLSFAYLICMGRLEMYKILRETEAIACSIDEIVTLKPIKKLEESSKWKRKR